MFHKVGAHCSSSSARYWCLMALCNSFISEFGGLGSPGLTHQLCRPFTSVVRGPKRPDSTCPLCSSFTSVVGVPWYHSDRSTSVQFVHKFSRRTQKFWSYPPTVQTIHKCIKRTQMSRFYLRTRVPILRHPLSSLFKSVVRGPNSPDLNCPLCRLFKGSGRT